MADALCSTCSGQGKLLVPRTDKDGNTKYVLETCRSCGGSGRLPS